MWNTFMGQFWRYVLEKFLQRSTGGLTIQVFVIIQSIVHAAEEL